MLRRHGGSAFERYFWTRVAFHIDHCNDAFAFSLVCKHFCSIFQNNAEEWKERFAVSADTWAYPRIMETIDAVYEGNTRCILPNGVLHNPKIGMYMGMLTTTLTPFYYHVIGLVQVQIWQQHTFWSSMISAWSLSFPTCRTCGRKHLIYKRTEGLLRADKVRGSLRCSIVQYARELKLK